MNSPANPADSFLNFPPWVESALIALLKKYVPADKVAAALQGLVDQAWSHIDAFVKSTPNPWDDAVAAKVKDALDNCAAGGDSDTICRLLSQGKAEFVRILRNLVATTKTKLDDAAVDIVAQALGVSG